MLVCICNCINEETIIKTIEEYNIHNVEELKEKINVCNNCCTCQRYIENMIELLKKA